MLLRSKDGNARREYSIWLIDRTSAIPPAPLLFLALSLLLSPRPRRIGGRPLPRRHSRGRRKTLGDIKPIWRFFGADEPNYATMTNGEKLIGELGALQSPRHVYFRAHNLLTSGDGTPASNGVPPAPTARTPTAIPFTTGPFSTTSSTPTFEHGVRPYVEIGFMPEGIPFTPNLTSINGNPATPQQYLHRLDYPPKDYDKWRELVYEWVKHCVERYGNAKSSHWYWEVWNEPNIGYWHGSPTKFIKLHDYAMDGVQTRPAHRARRRPGCRRRRRTIQRRFLEHASAAQITPPARAARPLDFISFHAKGSPSFVDGHVRMGIAEPTPHHRPGFAIDRPAVPELKDKPIVIGESDPDGCAACQRPPLGYRKRRCTPATRRPAWRAKTTWRRAAASTWTGRSRGPSSSRTSRPSPASAPGQRRH